MSLAARVAKATVGLSPEDARAILDDLETVQRAGIASVEQLVEAVGSASREPHIREIGCALLATVNERSAAGALANALEHGDDGLEWEAAKALIRLRTEDAAPTLVRVLRQGNPSKQSAAAYALGWLGVLNTITALRTAAMDLHLDVEVRGHAVEALGVIRAREAVPDLITLLSDVSPEIRYWTAYALGQIGDPASIPELERVAATDTAILPARMPDGLSVKQEALDALEAIRERGHDDL